MEQKSTYYHYEVFGRRWLVIRNLNSYTYRTQTIAPYEIESNVEYLVASTFKQIKRDGIFDVLSHSAERELSSLEATIEVLSLFRDWIENNRGWDEILSASTSKREKTLQRLLHLSGKYYCTQNNIDMTFEANEGPGPVDLKMSREKALIMNWI